jgi:cytochrome c
MRAALVLLLALAAPPALAATGEELFNAQCGDCHTVGDASTDQGPSLKGVVGRPVAGAKDFAYSDALKAKGGTWTEAGLDAFLANPNATVPGTAMFGGAPVAEDRAAIIAYLKTVK